MGEDRPESLESPAPRADQTAPAAGAPRRCDPRGWRHAILGVIALGAPIVRPELLAGEIGETYLKIIVIVLGAYLGKKALQAKPPGNGE